MAGTTGRWLLLWTGWTVFILLVGILPLSNFVGHSHWEYIKWLPTEEQLRSPAIVLELLLDMAANILLFVPFGFCYAGRAPSSNSSARTIILLALCLSCGIELYQVYCHNRNTSLLDILDNTTGAYLGLLIGRRFFGTALPAESRGVAPIPTA